jgi:prepilin-type N-terminal cleavage/methylation domain-containing protein
MRRQQGFTLIELLVVIAIIGILSAVVLASLNTARNKGSDAAIQSDLSSVQTQAEVYYSGTGNNTYGSVSGATGACKLANTVFSDATIGKAIDAAEVANGSGTGVICNNTSTTYAISSSLQAGIGGKMYWCVDSGGNAKAETNQLGAGVNACP